MEKSKLGEVLSKALDPPEGAVLGASAGGQVQCDFSFTNFSEDPATFYLEVRGLSPEWTQGVGEEQGTSVAASGSGIVRLTLTPDADAAQGDYGFDVKVISEGSPVLTRKLSLRVTGGTVPKPAAAPTAAPVFSDPPTMAVVTAAPPTPAAAKPAAWATETVADPPPTPSRRAASPPKETARTKPEAKVPPRPEPEQTAPTRPEPVFSQPPVEEAPPATAPEPESAPFVPAQFTPAPPEPEPVKPTPKPSPRVIDLGPKVVETQAEEAEALEAETVEPSIQDPPEATILPVRPGETLLVRFGFKSEQAGTTTYLLDHDGFLPQEWLNLIQDQVNLPRGVSGDVALRLTPPLDAEPGEYPFTVTLGPLGGARTPRSLILSVSATPAVKLTVKEPYLKIGPLASSADFQITVTSDGNADTAFRIAVKAPRSSATDAAKAPTEIYGTEKWRYLFDKEMADLRSPVAGQTPPPVPIRLRLLRKEAWWFGWKETHKVTVGAIPVTDTANGLKRSNTVELTAMRWRLLPFPALLLVPILILIFFVFSGSPDNLHLDGPQVSSSNIDNTVYVFGENRQLDDKKAVFAPDNNSKPGLTIPLKLQWQAPRFPLVNLHIDGQEDKRVFGQEEATSGILPGQSDKGDTTNFIFSKSYTVSPLLFGNVNRLTVILVPARTDNQLDMTDGNDRPLNKSQTLKPLLKAEDKVTESTYELKVPRSGNAVLRLGDKNSGLGVTIRLIRLDENFSQTGGGNPDEDLQIHIGKDKDEIKFSLKKSDVPAGTEGEFVFATTDAGHQILHIKLVVQ